MLNNLYNHNALALPEEPEREPEPEDDGELQAIAAQIVKKISAALFLLLSQGS